MKQLLLLSTITWLSIAMQACQFTSTPKELQKNTLRLATTEASMVVPTSSTSTTDTDTLIRIATSNSDTLTHMALIQDLRSLDETSIEPSEVLVELPNFSGKTIAESAAFLFLINQDTLKLYVDYFDGDLAGSKVFYIAAGKLMAVDVLEIEGYWTEGGEQVKSVLTHSFYYKEKELLCSKAYHYPERQVLLEQENAQDWVTIRQRLQIL